MIFNINQRAAVKVPRLGQQVYLLKNFIIKIQIFLKNNLLNEDY